MVAQRAGELHDGERVAGGASTGAASAPRPAAGGVRRSPSGPVSSAPVSSGPMRTGRPACRRRSARSAPRTTVPASGRAGRRAGVADPLDRHRRGEPEHPPGDGQLGDAEPQPDAISVSGTRTAAAPWTTYTRRRSSSGIDASMIGFWVSAAQIATTASAAVTGRVSSRRSLPIRGSRSSSDGERQREQDVQHRRDLQDDLERREVGERRGPPRTRRGRRPLRLGGRPQRGRADEEHDTRRPTRSGRPGTPAARSDTSGRPRRARGRTRPARRATGSGRCRRPSSPPS